MEAIDFFVPGQAEEGFLGPYLRPVPWAVVEAYVNAYTVPGDLVIDPFCQGPTTVAAITAAGRRIFAADFNPIAALVSRALLTLPPEPDFDTATSRLGDTLKWGVPLRQHIDQLYTTTCPQCGESVVADYFVWDRETNVPIAKVFRCPHCHADRDAPEEPVDETDLAVLARIEPQGVHYWHLLDRLAPRGDEHRGLARQLLALYTPRNLYALADLALKASTTFEESLLDAVQLTLLLCLERGSSLHASPDEPARPGRLRPPPRFVELNVWRTFEAAYRRVRTLRRCDPRFVPIRVEPASAQQVSKAVPAESATLIVTTPPAVDWAFWALSWMWSGWLLGPTAAAALRPLLRRQSPVWPWYARAMRGAFRALRPTLRADGRLVLVINAVDQPQIEALLLAAAGAGFALSDFAYRGDEGSGDYRLEFVATPRQAQDTAVEAEPAPADASVLASAIRTETLAAARAVLAERAEPVRFGWLHRGVWERLARKGLLRQAMALDNEEPLDFVRKACAAALDDGLKRGDLVALGDSEKPRLWWLREPPTVIPLGDRVEAHLDEALAAATADGLAEADAYRLFDTASTPEAELVAACFAAFGKEVAPGRWQRRADVIESLRADLVALGLRLGYAAREQGEATVVWSDAPAPMLGQGARLGAGATHVFAMLRPGELSSLLSSRSPFGDDESRAWIAIPRGCTELVMLRLRRSPVLADLAAKGAWTLVKAEAVQKLLAREEIERSDLEEIVGLEPLIEKGEQQLPLL